MGSMMKGLVSRGRMIRPLRQPLTQRSGVVMRTREGELNWDPEGLFGPPVTGLIAKREMQNRMETDKEFAAQVAEAETEIQKEVVARRAARVQPEDAEGFVEYFLNTDMEDMQHEVTKLRPKLKPEFFALLDKKIGTERFASEPDEDRLAELESLRAYLEEAVQVIDKAVSESGSAVERFKKLLTAKDKKATILEMVSANEIDTMLIDFMDQNIDAAKTAGEKDKADFMQKLRDACKRYAS